MNKEQIINLWICPVGSISDKQVFREEWRENNEEKIKGIMRKSNVCFHWNILISVQWINISNGYCDKISGYTE